MMGDIHKYSIFSKECIFAALNLSFDIFNLSVFLFVMLTGSD